MNRYTIKTGYTGRWFYRAIRHTGHMRYLCEQFLEVGAEEGGDLVSVQQVEAALVVAVVVHDAVAVAVERTAALARLHDDALTRDHMGSREHGNLRDANWLRRCSTYRHRLCPGAK